MNTTTTQIPGLLLIEPRVFTDSRGFFVETWQQSRYRDIGLPEFVQDNLSWSKQGVLRGMHFQNPSPQGKLVSVPHGKVYDVAVDLRKGSPTYGQWHGEILDSDSAHQFYIPPGFAHGFVVISEHALFSYKCTDFYGPTAEVTLRWDDPDIGIKWPVSNPIISEKDRNGIRLCDIPSDKLVAYSE